ncbi:hypothetical protein XENOCAPTIV_029428, partial [Xenoophorus captivus]
VSCQAQSRSSTCRLRHPACIAARPPMSWEQKTVTSTWPFTTVRVCFNASNPLCFSQTVLIKAVLCTSAAPDSPSGVLPGVLITLVMSLVLLALLVLILWLHRTGQDGRGTRGGRKAEEEECYNEIRYTPSLMKRSFV